MAVATPIGDGDETLLPIQGNDLRDRIKELIQELTQNYLELGQRLWEVKTTEQFKDWGYGSFDEYVERDTGFKPRRMRHYVEIFEELVHKRDIPEARLRLIGWSKVKTVLPMIREDTKRTTCEKWLKRAEKHSRRNLDKIIKDEKAKRAENEEDDSVEYDRRTHDIDDELDGVHEAVDVPFVDPSVAHHQQIEEDDPDTGEKVLLDEFKVFLYPTQWANVMAAMERAGQIMNSDKANYLLDMICMEWNSSMIDAVDGGAAQRLDWMVKNLERVFDVRIEVEVPDDSKLNTMSRLKPKKKAKKKAAKKKQKKTDSEDYAW